jgi:hypothetical protein
MLYITLSTLYFWISAFKEKKEILHSDNNFYYALFLGSLIGVGIILYLAFDGILFFIPESWGSVDNDGEYQSLRSFIAALFAFILSAFLHTRPFELVKLIKSKED